MVAKWRPFKEPLVWGCVWCCNFCYRLASLRLPDAVTEHRVHTPTPGVAADLPVFATDRESLSHTHTHTQFACQSLSFNVVHVQCFGKPMPTQAQSASWPSRCVARPRSILRLAPVAGPQLQQPEVEHACSAGKRS